MSFIDRLRSILGGPKEPPAVDQEAVERELAVEAVEHDVARSREDALSGEKETIGPSDGSAFR
jgi:hypothetical protein